MHRNLFNVRAQIIGIIVGIIACIAPLSSFAATLTLSPASGTFTIGSIITVNVQLSTGTDQIDGVDIRYLNYPKALLQVLDENSSVTGVQITAGSLLPITQQNGVDLTDPTLGRIDFSQVAAGGARYNNASPQTLATVRFQVLAAGNAPLTFTYAAGSTTDTNVATNGADTLAAPANPAATFTLNAAFNYSLTATTPAAVNQGGSTTSTISTALLSGTTTPVTFSASGLPTGTTATFAPTSCSPACTSTLTLQTSATTPAGAATITVTGVGGGVTKTAPITLTVNPPLVSNISFNVSLEGDTNQNDNPFSVIFYTPGTTTIRDQYSNRTPVSGKISIASTILPSGSYDIKFVTPFYLAEKLVSTAIASNATITIPALLGGDLNSDNTINSLDWSLMSPQWNTPDTANAGRSDINKDSIVNSIDFSFMNKNWGVAGDT